VQIGAALLAFSFHWTSNRVAMISVITLSGSVHQFDLQESQNSSPVEQILLEMIEKKLNISKNSFKLVPASPAHDSFILVPIRTRAHSNVEDTPVTSPTMSQIKSATKHFVQNSNTNVREPSSTITELLAEQMRNFLSRMRAHTEGSETTLTIPLPRATEPPAPPPPESIARLKEMGFSEPQVVAALQRAHNDEQLAAEYLLGDADDAELLDQGDSGDEDAEGTTGTHTTSWEFDLDLGNPNDILQIVQTVLSTPALQQGLTNPRVVAAFQDMIQNPNTVQNYLNDPEIGPIITQIYNSLQGE